MSEPNDVEKTRALLLQGAEQMAKTALALDIKGSGADRRDAIELMNASANAFAAATRTLAVHEVPDIGALRGKIFRHGRRHG